MNALLVGARLARERLRGCALPIVLALTGGTVYALALLERRASGEVSADHALEGPVFGIALPILAYLLSERVCNAERLDRSLDSVARHGTDRRGALLGVLLVSAVCLAGASALLTVLALLGAHPPHDPDMMLDLSASLGVALISGAAYACWFGAASLLGKRGGGRKWALISDFILGAGSSALAAPFPRGHLRNLLGGTPVLDLSQHSAWAALCGISVVCAGWCVARTPS